MQTFGETRNKVNGKFLPDFNGKPITMLGKVVKVHSNGTIVELQSTDNHTITVVLNEPLMDNLEGWVEVRGNGQGKSNIMCQQITSVNDICQTFDADLYDDLTNVINSCNNVWAPTQM